MSLFFLAWPRVLTCAHAHNICACLRATTLVNPFGVCSLKADQLTDALLVLAWGISRAGGTSAIEGSHGFHCLPLKAQSQC